MEDLGLITDWSAFRATSDEAAETGVVLVYGEFCRELEETVLRAIHIAITQGLSEMTLHINSRGGDDRCYAAIVSAMLQSNLKTRGLVLGYAESNAAYLLQRCDVRSAFMDSTIMFHYGGYELNNSQLAAIMRRENWPLDDIRQFFTQETPNILVRSGMTGAQFDDLVSSERVLCAKTALRLGLLDEIVE